MLVGINLLFKNARYSLGEEVKKIGKALRATRGAESALIIMRSIDHVLQSVDERVQKEVEMAFVEGAAHTLMLVLPMMGFSPLGETWPLAPDGKTCLGCVAHQHGVTREEYRALFKEHEERLDAVKKAFAISEEAVIESAPRAAKKNYDSLFIDACHFGDENVAYFLARMLTEQWKKTHPASCPHSSK